jgi:hypothetical protein
MINMVMLINEIITERKRKSKKSRKHRTVSGGWWGYPWGYSSEVEGGGGDGGGGMGESGGDFIQFKIDEAPLTESVLADYRSPGLRTSL